MAPSERPIPAPIAAFLTEHADWNFDGQALTRTFDRHDFNGSIAFVNTVAGVANALDHHPDIALSWNAVTLRIWSHDVDAITERDFAFVARIDTL